MTVFFLLVCYVNFVKIKCICSLCSKSILATEELEARPPPGEGHTSFYSDAGLPTLNCNNRIIRNITHINTFLNSLDSTLSNNPLCFLTGHWFSRCWVNARTAEWFTLAVEAAFQVTLTATQVTPKPLSECLLEDWRSSWTPPPPGDKHCHFTPLGEPPDLPLHPFVQGVLMAESHAYQSTAFQIITGHAFDASYSFRFQLGAGDNTTCPHCGEHYTVDHVLFDCDHFWYECATIIQCDRSYLFSTLSGSKMLIRFLHHMQSLLHPLPAHTDPPD
jgi:hypothetical protein